jgi:hypothetical protein
MDELTIEPSESGGMMRVTVKTTFELRAANEQVGARLEAARTAALSGTDAWAIRFGRLDPQEEQVTYGKSRGLLEQVTRSARIDDDDLQQLFSDTNITIDVLHGEGWHELTFYPGTSGRATREQRQRFETGLAQWSEAVARYFTAMDHLYTYLDEKPQRAPTVFAALLSEEGADGEEPVVSEEEQLLLEAVGAAMEDITRRMDYQEGRASTFAEEADLIFNPFPARITLRLPSDVLASEGFSSKEKGTLTIEPVDLYVAIGGLEGEWISPDPMAFLLREQAPTAEEMAALPRHSQKVVSSSEIARSITNQLTRPKTYRVRWRADGELQIVTPRQHAGS